MKKIIIVIIIMVITAFFSFSDVYVKGVLHVDGGYRWGQNVPENNAVYEWWFSKDKVTLIVTGWRLLFLNTDRRLTFDTKKNRIIAADLIKKSFVEIPLNKNSFPQIDPTLIKTLERFKIFGTVKETGKNKIILHKSCEEYKVHEWILRGDIRYYEREKKVMASINVSFEWKLINKLYEWIRSLFNPQGSYITELKKISGFIFAEEGTIYESAGEVTYNFKIEKITHLKPPSGIYDIPKGFQKKTKFGWTDLLDIRDLLYPWPLQ